MHLIEVVRRPDPATVAELQAFAAGRGLSDHLSLDLAAGGGPGFVGVRIQTADTSTVAYAQVSVAAGGAELEAVGDDPAAALDAVETALDAFATDGGGTLTWWVDDPPQAVTALATAHGLAPVRGLHEMRRPLPHERRADIVTRAFRPGTSDEDAWLHVNNRAFADHPEQGGWTRATLTARLAADWFDADGFRLHEVADGSALRLAGFCWTKVHPATATDPQLGEIYVIAADPDFAGRGLGTQLTLAGLDWLTEHGVTTADLYVDADNTAAFNLYTRLGFHIHRTRTAFTGQL
ncbi:MAG TPA: mycothiol synthase [Ilumatobacter sp.]|nr:mycothiol synthase [Ilumatobacter sp.]